MDGKNLWAGVAVAVSMALVAPAAAETRDAASSADAFVGVWLLDAAASDSISPLLEWMDAPWIAQKLADTMLPTITISLLGDGSLKLLNENALQTTERQIFTDGAPHEQKDALGRKVVATGAWSERGELVIAQANHIRSDRIVHVSSTWTRAEDRLEQVTQAETDDGPIQIRRVFRLKP